MEEPTKTSHSVTAVVLALIVMVFFLDLATPLGYVVWVFYLLPLKLTRWSPFRPLIAIVTVTCTALIIFRWFYSPPVIVQETAAINRLLGVFMLWTSALFLWFEKR